MYFKILKNYKFIFISLLFFTAIALYSFSSSFYFENFLLAINNAILILAILLLISRWRILSVLFIIILSIFITAEVINVAVYSSQLSYEVIASIFETNSTEASDMLTGIIKYIPLTVFLIVCIPILCYFSRKEQLKHPIKKIILYSLFVTSSLVVGLKSFIYVKSGKYDSFLVKSNFETNPLISVGTHIFVWAPSFFCTFTYVIAYLHETYDMYKYAHEKKIVPEDLYPGDIIKNNLPSTIFLVIGESSNRDHYSLYGYPIVTTPILDSLVHQNKLFFVKGVSPSSSTREAIPFTFTFNSIGDTQKSRSEKNIINLATDLGYESYWISGQDKIGLYDSPISYIASTADFEDFPSEKLKDRLDINLIDKIQKIFAPNKKQIFIIHLRGSHQLYTNGYDIIDKNKLQTSSNITEIDYDRTIHHTDRVLGSIFKNFLYDIESDSIPNRILFYFSDHGEIVNYGHALTSYNMDQFKIPFIVIGTTSYLNEVDSITQKYINNNFFNTVNFPYVFSEFMGYKVKEDALVKAKEDALYFRRIDRKILKFSEDMK